MEVLVFLFVLGVTVLGSWRITYMVQSESLPYNLMGYVRYLLGERFDINGNVSSSGTLVFECLSCTSIWIAGFVIAGYLFFPLITFFILLAASLSASVVLVDKLSVKKD